MTRKEFKEHNWKVGEVIHRVTFKEYEYVSIPYKVFPATVRLVDGDWVYTNGIKYPPTGINETSQYLKYFFFTKQEADNKLKELKEDFIKNKKDSVLSSLKNLRYRLNKDYQERSEKIESLLQMEIISNGL